jgi:hypothetical protein
MRLPALSLRPLLSPDITVGSKPRPRARRRRRAIQVAVRNFHSGCFAEIAATELHYPRLAGSIARNARGAKIAEHRGEIDDAARTTPEFLVKSLGEPKNSISRDRRSLPEQ